MKFLEINGKYPQKQYLVRISDIVRVENNREDDEEYYITVTNQAGKGNEGENLNELTIGIDLSEYIEIKEFLNQ